MPFSTCVSGAIAALTSFISVALAGGGGFAGFEPPQPFPIGNDPQYVTLGDIEEDDDRSHRREL